MKLEGDSAFLDLERAELGTAGAPVDRDVLLNVTVKVSNYSAADQCWIAESDLRRFVLQLRELESRRQGQAVLVGANSDDLQLEFHSTDSSGHMAVKGHIGWERTEGLPVQLSFGFAFAPDRLHSLLEYFENISH